MMIKRGNFSREMEEAKNHLHEMHLESKLNDELLKANSTIAKMYLESQGVQYSKPQNLGEYEAMLKKIENSSPSEAERFAIETGKKTIEFLRRIPDLKLKDTSSLELGVLMNSALALDELRAVSPDWRNYASIRLFHYWMCEDYKPKR